MTITAQVFIDCSYEGDLMARAGVSYTWGRESRDEYGESLAGVRPNLALYAIDPYVTPGDAKSGLLPFIQDMQAQPEGSADRADDGLRLPLEVQRRRGPNPHRPAEDITIRSSGSCIVAASKPRPASTWDAA